MAELNPNRSGGKADYRFLRCPHCAGPLTKEMIGSAVGGTAGAFYGFNRTMPIVRRWIRGPMWLHFFIGTPPVIIFSSGCGGLAGGSIPALAQLASSTYHAFLSTPPPPSSSS
ncbi:uncharacterized protein LOC131013019 isoform X2 [Salvia miltiorrhiza]|uniref:uncharacterized protein LOC131013019 isoform X2 n=1 Tax=Salvia miltiorrhiza TaxID=226208 RepID=UPI0025AD5D10|nr:uncharacterized protein LOC131013019 isoform X2 [Salvia miltiorrhiza]